jgi:hypothetical protein
MPGSDSDKSQGVDPKKNLKKKKSDDALSSDAAQPFKKIKIDSEAVSKGGSTQIAMQMLEEKSEQPLVILPSSLSDAKDSSDTMDTDDEQVITGSQSHNPSPAKPSSPEIVLDEMYDRASAIIACLIKKGVMTEEDKKTGIGAIVKSGLLPKPHALSSLSPISPIEKDISSYDSSLSPNTAFYNEYDMPDRGRTMLGPQGEHVSAYTLYEELVFSIIENTNTKHAIDELSSGLACLPLNEKAKKELEAIYEGVGEQIKENISREKRRKITGTLTACHRLTNDAEMIDRFCDSVSTNEENKKDAKNVKQNLKEIQAHRLDDASDITKVRDAIRDANRLNLSTLVQKTVNVFLAGANKMDYVSFPEEGAEPNPNTGQEKVTKNSLRLLSDFLHSLYDVLDKDPQTEETEFIGIVKAYGAKLKDYFGIEIDLSSGLKIVTNQKLTQEEKFQQLTDCFINVIVENRIAAKISALFWYPKLENQLNSTSNTWKDIVERKRYNKGTQPRNNDLTILYHVTARHIVLIFNCFNALQMFNSDRKEKIIDTFLVNVIKDQHWEQMIELQQLKEAITDKIKLNPDTKNFVMPKEEKSTTSLSFKM